MKVGPQAGFGVVVGGGCGWEKILGCLAGSNGQGSGMSDMNFECKERKGTENEVS